MSISLNIKSYEFIFQAYFKSFRFDRYRSLSFSPLFCRRYQVNKNVKAGTILFSQKVWNNKKFLISHYSSNMSFKQEKEKFLHMNLSDKRKLYRCGEKFVPLNDVLDWNGYFKIKNISNSDSEVGGDYSKNTALNSKISIFVGDITALEIDAIVNAANKTLRGGGGVDGAIHRAAGSNLLDECITLNGCDTGEAKITGGYKLPAKYVIHTVGPVGEKPELLKNCYVNSLNLLKENNLRSIAFPCVSTGVYGYPNKNAAHIALKTIREFLEKNEDFVDRIIFCLFLPVDVGIYESLTQVYFPIL